MNKGFLTIGIIILAVVSFYLINMISNASSGSELDFYLVKETAEAAMVDAVDYDYYRSAGSIRIDSDKFVESYLRRFADSVDLTRNYRIGFYDLNEAPPKVSVKVDSSTSLSFNADSINLSTSVDAVLESNNKNSKYLSDSILNGKLDGQMTENR